VSNLLIGIIGVALFIGLAMGAALFIGPQFDEAQTNAQASDTVMAVSSVAAAVNSYRLATGYSQGGALSSVQALVSGGYLRDVPSNSAFPARRPQIVNAAGVDAVNTTTATFQPRFVVMSLGSNEDLCTTIQKKLGNIASGTRVSQTTLPVGTAAVKQVGCFRNSSNGTDFATGEYLVYSRI
jgi:hypothetical protein